MPPKRVAAAPAARRGGRGPKAAKLCIEVPSKTEIVGRPAFVVSKEIGKGGFARVYAAEIKVGALEISCYFMFVFILLGYERARCDQGRAFRKWLFIR